MKRVIISLFILILLIIAGFCIMWSKREKEPKGLVPKFEIGWSRKDEFAEFSKVFKLPLIWPKGLLIKGDYLYAPDFSEGIQILKVEAEGKLFPKFYFGKRYKDITVLYTAEQGLATRGKYLYVADSGNQRIQALEIKY